VSATRSASTSLERSRSSRSHSRVRSIPRESTLRFHSDASRLASDMVLGNRIAMCCVATLGVHAWNARADSIDDSGPRRELAGHVFFPSLVVANPFLSTYIALFTAAGYDWIEGPDFDGIGNLAARPVTRERSYAAQAIAEGVTFQANVTDYLAIRIAGGGGLEGGSNGRSALVVGAIEPITAGAG